MIKSVRFLKSNSDYKSCPEPDRPEYAFIGRSNVGKSSLINMLSGVKNLAKVSSKPGKTQLINHFEVNESWYLVDLPGYGWAKASKEEKAKWEIMIQEYLLHRQNLMCIFLLIDSRLEPQKIDLEFINWLGEKEISFVLLFTKCDKQSKNKTNINVDKFMKNLTNKWEELPQFFLTSCELGLGKEDVIKFIEQVNKDFKINS